MVITGKRHDFVVDYAVGFDDDGRIRGVEMTYAARCGFSADLSGPVTDRALFHADNCYYFENVELRSLPLKTNTVSNTAFRGFGGPQGMVAGERLIEEIAYALGKDPLEVRKLNFYGEDRRNVTPYHQTVEDNVIHEIVAELERSADYRGRRQAIRERNASSRVIKRGLALTPVKFGISFTATQYNQAGALVHVYTDGSIHLNHGGTEMGQGLYTKVAQVVAEEFQVDVEQVRITATTTGKVPNTSATAASSAPTSTARRRRPRRARSRRASSRSPPSTGACRRSRSSSCPAGCASATRRSCSASWSGRPTWRASRCPRPASTRRPRSTGTARAAGAAVLLLRLWRRGERGRDRHADRRVQGLAGRHPPRRSAARSTRRSTSARSRAASSRAWAGSPPRSCGGTEKGVSRTHAPSTYKIPVDRDCWSTSASNGGRNPTARTTWAEGKGGGEPPYAAISVWEALRDAASAALGGRPVHMDAPATAGRTLEGARR